MQAITVKYRGPTNRKGSRYKATCWAGSVTLPLDYSLNGEGNAIRAAKALVEKMGWRGVYVMGETPDAYVFVDTAGGVAFSAPTEEPDQ